MADSRVMVNGELVHHRTKYHDAKELKAKIAEYLQNCKDNERVPSKPGLRFHLDVDDSWLRHVLARRRAFVTDDHITAIKRANDYIEQEWVNLLAQRNYGAGPIFYLKNAFHYRDVQNVDHTTGGQPIIVPNEIATREALRAKNKSSSDA